MDDSFAITLCSILEVVLYKKRREKYRMNTQETDLHFVYLKLRYMEIVPKVCFHGVKDSGIPKNKTDI